MSNSNLNRYISPHLDEKSRYLRRLVIRAFESEKNQFTVNNNLIKKFK